MTSPYTCITCHVAFRDLEIQRQHYKSDWHRYNLKRKVVELPPVTSEEFQKRVIAQRSKDQDSKVNQSISCKICRKNFNTKNQYENHILSKKHKENTALSKTIGDQVVMSVEDEAVNEKYVKSAEIPHSDRRDRIESRLKSTNNDDMEVDSDVESVDSDVESVDSDEWNEDTENPVKNNNCLFCSHHSRSFVRNLKHMTEAHTFFIPDFEYCVDPRGLLIYLGEKIYAGYMCLWCNDSGKVFQSAEAAKSHMIDKGHCKILHEGAALAEYGDFYDYSSSYPDGDKEDPDAEVEIPEIDDTDFQLVLPSGATIGHRSLMRYYKQSLNPTRAVAIPKREKLRRVLMQYRALGWTETQKEAAVKKARDIKYMQRIQAKYSTQLQFKANKFQRHYRPQVNF